MPGIDRIQSRQTSARSRGRRASCPHTWRRAWAGRTPSGTSGPRSSRWYSSESKAVRMSWPLRSGFMPFSVNFCPEEAFRVLGSAALKATSPEKGDHGVELGYRPSSGRTCRTPACSGPPPCVSRSRPLLWRVPFRRPITVPRKCSTIDHHLLGDVVVVQAHPLVQLDLGLLAVHLGVGSWPPSGRGCRPPCSSCSSSARRGCIPPRSPAACCRRERRAACWSSREAPRGSGRRPNSSRVLLFGVAVKA